MPSTVLVGAQWGDEGKGKITDLIARDYDYVVRYQGGNNAGHTVIHGDKKLALHLIPSGVMYETITPVIGNGVVVDPRVLVDEMAKLEAQGISCERLVISCDAHVIMPYHIDLDGASERRLGSNEIGTTRRGIGPAYQDKAARIGIRIQDLLDEHIFRQKLQTALETKNQILEKVYGLAPYTVDQICEEYLPYADIIRPHMDETANVLNTALRAGRNILFEGAQATLLDIDHGTYPFVTSSSCCAGGACIGTGVGPKAIDKVIGISKAYITRVGSGPFPTELFDEDGDKLCEIGGEFGVTTGRRRRCGWFDAVIARYATDCNSLTDMALTKLDVLSSFERIKVCVGYRADGKVYEYFPMQQSALYPKHVEPIYEELPGWQGRDITGCRSFEELPANAQRYVTYLEELCGVAMSIIAVGPDRDQTIFRGWESPTAQ
ncbi:Adenylosuccinate synthetase [Cryptobacterium curtum DSM 15641]|uniref:Adenylosuccinate synthetase n=1 Tax=Cryptobacterium curtum (strain ATCC 700683 / DSM 15641 / CCUG 43107 / 12-3) TaxID=469378 RepID=C7MPK0_CRYCD|nr:adenylosuccinate synthase [Cryptobacterium curtum]ACU94840.1 Adenylosuccinate synthetase [Cryptobacterium curtum DSM 15641]